MRSILSYSIHIWCIEVHHRHQKKKKHLTYTEKYGERAFLTHNNICVLMMIISRENNTVDVTNNGHHKSIINQMFEDK